MSDTYRPRWSPREGETKQTVQRIRGRAGVALRAHRLREEPLCRDCQDKGLITPATTPDHILPLAKGGTDIDSNIRCLCGPCHEARTREQFNHRKLIGATQDGWPDT